MRKLVMIQGFIDRLFLDRRFDAVGCTQRRHQPFAGFRVDLGSGDEQGGLGFPRQGCTFGSQTQYVVAGYRFALIGDAQEVTTIGGRGHGHGTGNAQVDVLPTIRCRDDFRQDNGVDRAFGNFAPDEVGQIERNGLVGGRFALIVFDADQQATA
jgi:hypothetical protein